MSKFFFKGRIDSRETYGQSGFNTNRTVKLGSEQNPLSLTVKSIARKNEIETMLLEHMLVAHIDVDDSKEESLTELDTILNKPESVSTIKTPKRNELCHCGSKIKYKKCCGK